MSLIAAAPTPALNLTHSHIAPVQNWPTKSKDELTQAAFLGPTRTQSSGSPESSGSDDSTMSIDIPAQATSASTPSGSMDLPDSTSQITRDWSVPSRPKPGRKPAIDTPPTKRKAQNRAAQRAFRQRRAAEVGDLQGLMNQQQSEFDQKEAFWEAEKQRYQQNVEQWRQNAEYWQQATNKEHEMVKGLEARIQDLQNQVEMSKRHSHHGNHLPSHVSATANPWEQSVSLSGTMPPRKESTTKMQPTDYREGSYRVSEPEVSGKDHVRSTYEELEIDFTSTFAKSVPRGNNKVNSSAQQDYITPSMVLPSPLDDGCGFCDPGGLCVCREIAAESTSTSEQIITLPSMSSITESLSNANPTPKRQTMEPRASATGPGSCPACMADPERQNFCRSLAGLMPPPSLPRRTSSSSTTTPIITTAEPPNKRRRLSCTTHSHSTTSEKLTCADTFNKLSQIPNFREHKDEIIYHLTAKPAKGDEYCTTCDKIGCLPLTVDTASLNAAILLTGLKDPTNFGNGSMRVEGGVRRELEERGNVSEDYE